MISFLDCPHKNTQEFTDCCLDCGYNINMSKAEYLGWLKQLAETKRLAEKTTDAAMTAEIRTLERALGI